MTPRGLTDGTSIGKEPVDDLSPILAFGPSARRDEIRRVGRPPGAATAGCWTSRLARLRATGPQGRGNGRAAIELPRRRHERHAGPGLQRRNRLRTSRPDRSRGLPRAPAPAGEPGDASQPPIERGCRSWTSSLRAGVLGMPHEAFSEDVTGGGSLGQFDYIVVRHGVDQRSLFGSAPVKQQLVPMRKPA